MTLSKEQLEIIAQIRQLNSADKVYLVGGAVRDLILDRKIYDLDFVVEGDGVELAYQFAKELGFDSSVVHRYDDL